MNMWTMRAGIGGMALEFQNDWDYRMSLGKPFVLSIHSQNSISHGRYSFCLQYVVLGDRAAWHRGPFWKWPTTNFPLIVQDGWWEPIRQSVVAFAAPSTREETTATPVITYISRQKTGRRLRAQDHDNLVEALENLGREHGYEARRSSFVICLLTLPTDSNTSYGRHGKRRSSSSSQSYYYSTRSSR